MSNENLLNRLKNKLLGSPGESVSSGVTEDSDVYVLGVKYERRDKSVKKKSLGKEKKLAKEVRSDIESIVWFTYRKDFVSIQAKTFFKIKYGITTDRGWGCMIRSGQMILGNAFSRLMFGRDWRLPKFKVYRSTTNQMSLIQQGSYPKEFYKLLNDFYDDPVNKYSIHAIVKTGMKFGKNPGEWFGPCTITNVLSTLVNSHEKDVGMYKARDGCLFSNDIVELAKQVKLEKKVVVGLSESIIDSSKDEKSKSKSLPKKKENKSLSYFDNGSMNGENFFVVKTVFRPVIIMIPIRLGLEKINPNYMENIKYCLRMPQSLGIIGGRPMHSLYFVGYQDDSFLFLDPHTTRKPTLNPSDYTCSKLAKLKFSNIDPSMSIGFLCKTQNELEDFFKSVKVLTTGKYPIFSVSSSKKNYEKSIGSKIITI